MKSPTRLLASTIIVAVLVGCGDEGSSSGAKISPVAMETPQGWIRKDNYPIGVGVEADLVLAAPPINGFSANVVVLSTPVSTMGLDQAVQSEISGEQAQIPSLVVDSNVARTVSGHSARLLQVRSVQNSRNILTRELMLKTSQYDIQVVFTREESDLADSATLLDLESHLVIR